MTARLWQPIEHSSAERIVSPFGVGVSGWLASRAELPIAGTWLHLLECPVPALGTLQNPLQLVALERDDGVVIHHLAATPE